MFLLGDYIRDKYVTETEEGLIQGYNPSKILIRNIDQENVI